MSSEPTQLAIAPSKKEQKISLVSNPQNLLALSYHNCRDVKFDLTDVKTLPQLCNALTKYDQQVYGAIAVSRLMYNKGMSFQGIDEKTWEKVKSPNLDLLDIASAVWAQGYSGAHLNCSGTRLNPQIIFQTEKADFTFINHLSTGPVSLSNNPISFSKEPLVSTYTTHHKALAVMKKAALTIKPLNEMTGDLEHVTDTITSLGVAAPWHFLVPKLTPVVEKLLEKPTTFAKALKAKENYKGNTFPIRSWFETLDPIALKPDSDISRGLLTVDLASPTAADHQWIHAARRTQSYKDQLRLKDKQSPELQSTLIHPAVPKNLLVLFTAEAANVKDLRLLYYRNNEVFHTSLMRTGIPAQLLSNGAIPSDLSNTYLSINSETHQTIIESQANLDKAKKAFCVAKGNLVIIPMLLPTNKAAAQLERDWLKFLVDNYLFCPPLVRHEPYLVLIRNNDVSANHLSYFHTLQSYCAYNALRSFAWQSGIPASLLMDSIYPPPADRVSTLVANKYGPQFEVGISAIRQDEDAMSLDDFLNNLDNEDDEDMAEDNKESEDSTRPLKVQRTSQPE
jgi:hypothetical protein